MEEISIITCPHCETSVTVETRYCGHCGKSIIEPRRKKNTTHVNYIIAFYVVFLLFAIIGHYAYEDSENVFFTEVVIEILFAVFTLGFAALDIKGILPLYGFSHIRWKGILMSLLVPLGTIVVVYYSVGWINEVIEGYNDNMYAEYVGYENPMLWAFLFIAITPPIFEELAFRGFLFNQLEQVASVKVTILATAFIFALVHFSFISFLWIFPFGIFLGYLRHKYKTLWLGMIVHFIHNLGVLLLDYYYFQ